MPAQFGSATHNASDWLLDCAEKGTTGTYNAVGPIVPVREWVALSRQTGGHTGPVMEADDTWLLGQNVVQAMGPPKRSLP